MKNTFFQFLLSCFLIFCTLFLVACPKKNQIEKASKDSYRLSALTVDAIDATSKAYKEGIVDLETKDRMALALDSMLQGSKSFTQLVKTANEEYKRTGIENIGTLRYIDLVFTRDVIAPFFKFLEIVKVIPSEKVQYLWAIVATLRTTLLTISNFFSAIPNIRNGADNENRLVKTTENKILLQGRWLYVRKFC